MGTPSDKWETSFTKLAGSRLPLQLSPMGGIGPELTAAVTNAGGFGMLAAHVFPPSVLAQTLDALSSQAKGPIGASFLMPFVEDREVVRVAASRVRIVEFFHADPEPELVRMVHAGHALASWQVGSLLEARAAESAGCDMIVVQGVEAGGRLRGTTGLFPLLAEVLDTVRVPVIAAGGISTPRSFAAALLAGASAVRMGTRFLGARESAAHSLYKEALFHAGADDTVLTEEFRVMWRGSSLGARVLKSCVTAARAFSGDKVGDIKIGGQTIPLPPFAVPPPIRNTTGTIAAMALYAGQGVGAVRREEPAADIVRELTDQARRIRGG